MIASPIITSNDVIIVMINNPDNKYKTKYKKDIYCYFYEVGVHVQTD